VTEDLEREWAFYARVVDPAVNEVLALDDAWEAYHRTLALTGLLTDTSPGGSWELPHAGEVYAAWARLTDLYDTGKTPIDQAHATLRDAGTKWLDRPSTPTAGFIEQWVSEADEAAAVLFKRDGDWWNEPG
jgi:hypothetical protein